MIYRKTKLKLTALSQYSSSALQKQAFSTVKISRSQTKTVQQPR